VVIEVIPRNTEEREGMETEGLTEEKAAAGPKVIEGREGKGFD
jgi:hypothetical protein